jgi:adenylyltransferase/sulfurtransferase
MSNAVHESIKNRSLGINLTVGQRTRYSRHMLLPEVGESGQKCLAAARVLVIGAGGLGAPASLYLTAAGVGHIGLADFDVVDATNLQRQILFTESDVGRSKLEATAERLHAQNPDMALTLHSHQMDAANVSAVIESYDIVIDGTDNFSTRYLVNDACVLAGKPNIYGSVYRFEGQASVFYPPEGPCYRCLFPTPPPPGSTPNCAEGGVLGVLPGQLGLIQATEAIKLILGLKDSLVGRLLMVDTLAVNYQTVKIPKDPECIVCGPRASLKTMSDSQTNIFDNSAEPDTYLDDSKFLTPVQLKELIAKDTLLQMIDVRSKAEATICSIPGFDVVPLSDLAERSSAYQRDRLTIVSCKSGGRSAQAYHQLKELGFQDLYQLKGGILAWIDAIDPSLSRY